MLKRKKLYIAVLILAVLFAAPYLFRKNLCVQVADFYVNSANPDWDTVFVDTRPVNEDIELDDLTLSDSLKYEVVVWKGKDRYNPKYENQTDVIDSLFQIGPYAEVDITAFAWEGTEMYHDTYIWALFCWIRIGRLTGYA